jgi:hypothetical protein
VNSLDFGLFLLGKALPIRQQLLSANSLLLFPGSDLTITP